MIKIVTFALFELGSITFFLWASYFLAHLIAGGA